MNNFKTMSDEHLRKNYVPDVYQRSIYAIDYQKLKDAGIKLISFDIDDTIAGLVTPDPPKEAKTLFESLKSMGFEVWLLSNTWDKRATHFAMKLGIEDKYQERARKPLTAYFQKLLRECGLDKSQMAHVGNCIVDDVAGGNAAGVTTCLVRRAGIVGKIFSPDEPKLIDELKERGIWRKHHKYHADDQYYQFGETPRYIDDEQAEAYAEGMRSRENAYIESLKKQIK